MAATCTSPTQQQRHITTLAPHNNWNTPHRWHHTALPEKPISRWIWARATCLNWSKQTLLGQKKYHTPPIPPIHSPHLMEERFLLCNLVSSLNNPLTDCWSRKAMIRKWYCLVPASVGFPERDGKYWIILRFLLADAHREKTGVVLKASICVIFIFRGEAHLSFEVNVSIADSSCRKWIYC